MVVSMVTGCNIFSVSHTVTAITLHIRLKMFSVGCCLKHCCKPPVYFHIISLCFQLVLLSLYLKGEISRRLHLVLRQSRVPCIHHSRPSLSGSSCHFRSVLYEWCLPSGATHAGEYILPGHWKENLTSAMLILAVISSSICGNKEQWLRCHFTSLLSLGFWGKTISFEMYDPENSFLLPWHSCCWDSGEGSSVPVCVRRPFHKQCPGQTSPPASGPQQSLTAG